MLSPQPERRFDALGVGECSLDTWLRVAAWPRLGGKAEVLDWRALPGGQIATATLAAARLGLRTAFAGAVGADAAAAEALAGLRGAGVELSRVVVLPEARTRAAVIAVEAASGERAVFGFRDARLDGARAPLAQLALSDARLLLLDASDFALACELAERAQRAGLPSVLDLDTPLPGFEALLACVTFPVVSASFAERAYGSPRAAVERMAALGARLPVVTLGAAGALAWQDGEPLESPGFRVEALDTTGAGDAFHGAFAWGLLAGLDAPALLRAANAVAALACTGLGAQGALPDRAALEGLLASQPGGYSSS